MAAGEIGNSWVKMETKVNLNPKLMIPTYLEPANRRLISGRCVSPRNKYRAGSVAIQIGNAVSCILSDTVFNLKMVRPYFIRFTYIGYIGSMA